MLPRCAQSAQLLLTQGPALRGASAFSRIFVPKSQRKSRWLPHTSSLPSAWSPQDITGQIPVSSPSPPYKDPKDSSQIHHFHPIPPFFFFFLEATEPHKPRLKQGSPPNGQGFGAIQKPTATPISGDLTPIPHPEQLLIKTLSKLFPSLKPLVEPHTLTCTSLLLELQWANPSAGAGGDN